MALQELSAPPPVTGFAQLGQAITNAGNQYIGRQQQLADVASARNYADVEGDKRRAEQLADSQTMDQFRGREAAIRLLIERGYLTEDQRDNEAAVNKARQQAAQDGMATQYRDVLQTVDPTTGQPLLTQDQVYDVKAVSKAIDRLAAIKGAQAQQQLQLTNAEIAAKQKALKGGQAAADRSLQGEQQLDAQIAALTAELNRPVPSPAPDEIKAAARVIWSANHQGKTPPTNDALLGTEIEQAKKELTAARFLQEKERHDQIVSQIILLREQIKSQQHEAGDLGKQGFFADPSVTPKAAPVSTAPVQQMRPLDPMAAQNAAAAFLQKAAPIQAAAPVAENQVMANPTRNPLIDAGNQDVQQQVKMQGQAALNQAIARGQQIDQQLQSMSVPQRPTLGVGMGGMSVSMAADPLAGRDQAASLLKQKAENDQQIAQLKAQLMGPMPASSTQPAINTQTFSQPTPAFAVPGGVLQQGAQGNGVNWWDANRVP